MAEDEDANIIKKAEEEKEHDMGTIEENTLNTDPETDLRAAQENLREEARKTINKDDIPAELDNMKQADTGVDSDQINSDRTNPENVENKIRRTKLPGKISRKSIKIIVVIGIIVLGVFLIYSVFHLNNESYKAENYNAFWNQSLADLKGGKITMDEYCTNRVHDEQFCNQFASLQYMH